MNIEIKINIYLNMISRSINIIIFFLFAIFAVIFCSESEYKLKGEYLNQYQEHKTYIFQLKLASCMSLISHSLKGPEGNKYLHQAIKKTKLNRDKFYEKYNIALITQCINNVNEGQLEYLLVPENVDAYNVTTNSTLLNLVKLEYEITTLDFTPEEREVKKVIDEIIEENEAKKKKKKSLLGFLDYNTLIKILCGSVPLLIFFIYNSRKMFQKPEKKELDEGTKELLEAIKARGKNSPNYKETKEDKEKEKEKEKEEKDNKDNKEKKD